MEHVPCTDIPCLNGCAFNGGYSGYCSVCWRGLSDDAKREANAKQAPLQKEREAAADVRREEETREKRKREEEWKAKQDELHDAALKKAKQEEEEEAARENPKCERIASNRAGFVIKDEHKWLQWDWVKLSADPGDGRDRPDTPCEIGTCGMYNAQTYPLSRHDHPSTSVDTMAELLVKARELSRILENTQEGSSEGGEPWVGFYIIPNDMPGLNAKSSSSDIMKAVLGEATFSALSFQKESTSDYRIFSNDAENAQVYKDAAEIIFSVAQAGTAFRLVPGGDGDFYVGPTFIGARTSDGNIIGVRSHVVWT